MDTRPLKQQQADQRGLQVPSGNPALTRISFSWTLASQVILRVDMLRRLCSQKLFSASWPLILNVEITKDEHLNVRVPELQRISNAEEAQEELIVKTICFNSSQLNVNKGTYLLSSCFRCMKSIRSDCHEFTAQFIIFIRWFGKCHKM